MAESANPARRGAPTALHRAGMIPSRRLTTREIPMTDHHAGGQRPDLPLPSDGCAGILEQLAVASLVAEAEDLLRGVRYLSIATGDPETDDDLARVNALTSAAWTPRADAATTAIRGGNDYLTIRVEGAAADAFVDDLAELAQRLNPGFWRINRSPHAF